MTKNDIIVGQKYKNGFYSYLGIGKKVPFVDNEYTDKNLLCLDEGSEGLIVNNPEDCAPHFWDSFCLENPLRRTVKVHFSDGNSITTGINGTVSEIIEYYLNKQFNFGIDEDDLSTAIHVEFLD